MSTQPPESPEDAEQRGPVDQRANAPVADSGDAQDPLEAEADDEGPRTFGASVLAGVREIVIVVVLALALSFIVKTWLFQAFYIPSGSMEDTLVPDDRVIVSKLTPGPFELRRGDVIVFEDPGVPQPWLSGSQYQGSSAGGPFHDLLVFVGLLPEDSENHLIKRVIGLPGDHVQSKGGEEPVLVNGVTIDEPYWKHGAAVNNKAFDIVVPPNSVWVMGDNRSDSSDSRYHDDDSGGKDGSVPMSKIVGRALFIVWPLDRVTWLGVPARTFDKVPAPSSTSPTDLPTVRPSGTATGSASGSVDRALAPAS